MKKDLNICLCIYVIGDKKMRIVQLGYEKYYIQSKDDLIYLVHKLAYKGFSVSEIAIVLGLSEKTVKKYLEDCW